jgi:DNA topoisomerase I
MKLVIVETPAQAKAVATVLGDDWRVEPCYGVVRDLPPKTLGVDVENGFRPTFNIVQGKGGIVVRLKKALRAADAVYVATPPGCDGEAMAWHVLALEPAVTEKKKPVYRVTLDALTRDAVRDAFASPLPLNMSRVDAALTVRIANRLAGFTVNRAVDKAFEFGSGLTYAAMVALRLLVGREAAAASTYWSGSVRFSLGGVPFDAKVLNAKGHPVALRSEAQAQQMARMLEYAQYWIEKRGGTTRAIPAPDPFTLAALIQAASRDLNMSAERTIAQVSLLYEAGWITHPDRILLSDSAEAAQMYIEREYGAAYRASAPAIANGIAPTYIERLPEDVPGDGAALYGLIWRHFIAAHMTPTQERISAARIRVGPAQDKPYPVTLLAQSGRIAFAGWMRVIGNCEPNRTAAWLPLLKEGLKFTSNQRTIRLEQHPLAERFTEAALVAALVHSGFSVLAAADAVTALLDDGLIAAAAGTLGLTDNGLRIADHFRQSFGQLTSAAYAAEFFAGVDVVAAGRRSRADLLTGFWLRCAGAESEAEKPEERQSHKPDPLVDA